MAKFFLSTVLFLLTVASCHAATNNIGDRLYRLKDGDGYSSGIIKTPQIDLSNAAECTITLKAYGTAGDYLCVLVNGKNYIVTIPSDGIIDGSFLLPVGGSFSYKRLVLSP